MEDQDQREEERRRSHTATMCPHSSFHNAHSLALHGEKASFYFTFLTHARMNIIKSSNTRESKSKYNTKRPNRISLTLLDTHPECHMALWRLQNTLLDTRSILEYVTVPSQHKSTRQCELYLYDDHQVQQGEVPERSNQAESGPKRLRTLPRVLT